MFSNAIVNSDVFLDLPLSTQALYFHLVMEADDEGFVGNPKRLQRVIGASNTDMQNLIDKRYILTFPSGIVVIKHWYIHNYIPKDRYNQTTYTEEKQTLTFDSKNGYTEKSKCHTKCIQDDIQTVDKVDTQIKLNEIKVNKSKLNESNTHAHEMDFLSSIPTLDEVKEYITLKDFKVDPERFYNYYDAKGWRLGNTQIENWKSLINNWAIQDGVIDRIKTESVNPQAKIVNRKYSQDELNTIFGTSDISDDEI